MRPGDRAIRLDIGADIDFGHGIERTSREGVMGDQQALFLCILASGSFGALLGGSFGAVVGAVTWLSGRAAGTILGFQMARAYESAAESKLAPGPKGALIGGTDGAIFLGSIGLVGGVVASRTPVPSEVLEPTAAAAVMLVGTCIVFGMIALVLTRSGTHAVVPLFARRCRALSSVYISAARTACLWALSWAWSQARRSHFCGVSAAHSALSDRKQRPICRTACRNRCSFSTSARCK